ncbi:ABC transporter, partial [Glaciimonas sp. CA11.2]|nr:ABC transporter [Glaciimonas sp. CA11.2]
ADGKVEPFDGDLDDYKDWLFKTKLAAKNVGKDAGLPKTKETAKITSAVAPAAAPQVDSADRREQKRQDAEARQKLASLKKPIESKIKRLDEQLAKRNAQKATVDTHLANPEVYDKDKKKELTTLLTDQAFYAKELAQLEAEWLEQQEALEQLGN